LVYLDEKYTILFMIKPAKKCPQIPHPNLDNPKPGYGQAKYLTRIRADSSHQKSSDIRLHCATYILDRSARFLTGLKPINDHDAS
jgi:hypothetical protein